MTRGHKAALVKSYCRLDIRIFSFSQRTINNWNQLSHDCVNASFQCKCLNKKWTIIWQGRPIRKFNT